MQTKSEINLEQYNNLIWSIVNKLLGRLNNKYYYIGLEQDLFQEGYLGLLDAYNRYNQDLQIQFSTFAYKYIYGYCLNYLKKELLSLRCEDIDDSPSISQETYDIENCIDEDIFKELKDTLKSINKTLSETEEKILIDRFCNEFTLQKCATRNNCSVHKVSNTIKKYKSLIKEILIR